MTPLMLKIRPFQTYVPQNPPHLPMLRVEGRVSGREFVVGVLGQEVALETAEIGEDTRGTWAVVKEGTFSLRDGYELVAEAEADPIEPPALSLLLIRQGDQRKQVSKTAGSHMLVAPYERFFAVHFHPDGQLESFGAPSPGQQAH